MQAYYSYTNSDMKKNITKPNCIRSYSNSSVLTCSLSYEKYNNNNVSRELAKNINISIQYIKKNNRYKFLKNEYNLNKFITENLLGAWSSLNNIIITNVNYDGLKLRFYEPFVLKYIKEDDGYIYDNNDLEMYLYGESIEELKESFYEDLVVSWKLYVKCDEDELTDGAKDLRKKLLKIVKEI